MTAHESSVMMEEHRYLRTRNQDVAKWASMQGICNWQVGIANAAIETLVVPPIGMSRGIGEGAREQVHTECQSVSMRPDGFARSHTKYQN